MSSTLRDRFEAILQGRAAMPAALAALLAPASALQRAGMARRLRAMPEQVGVRVVSYGNLTLGGTGKTPAVIARAEAELARGRRPALITRGYHAVHSAEPLLFANNEPLTVPSAEVSDLARRFGDEAALVAWRAPGCAIVKGRDRVAAARAAVDELGCDLLLLDDAFQYVRLARDENILLIDASCPFGNGRVFPAGYLREPRSAAARATEIVLTRCDQVTGTQALEAILAESAPGVVIRKTRHAPISLVSLDGNADVPLAWLAGRSVRPICGIGNPAAFLRTLGDLGATCAPPLILPDHGTLPPGLDYGATPLVLTEKDAVKLSCGMENAYALRVGLLEI